MESPESLPARLFLLAYDPRRQRLTSRSRLGPLLRAAALTDLYLSGRLAEAGGKPRIAGREHVADPVLAGVLAQIAESRPRSWDHWITKDQRAMKQAVRDQLAAGRWIRVEPHRVLGLFPTTKITLRQPVEAKRLTEAAKGTLRPEQPLARIDPRDAAVVALAAAAELPTVANRRQRRENKKRIAELSDRSGPVPRRLRKVIERAAAAAASSG